MQPTIHMIHEVTKEHTNALAALVARACEHIKHVCSTHCFDITGIHANAKNAHTRHSLHAIVPRLPPAVIYNHTMKSQQPRQRIQPNHKEYACCRNSEITKKSQRKEYCFCTNNLVSLRKATKDAQCQRTTNGNTNCMHGKRYLLFRDWCPFKSQSQSQLILRIWWRGRRIRDRLETDRRPV